MPIACACSTCGKRYRVADDMAGRKGKCTCGDVFVIPQIAAPEPTAIPPLPPPPPKTAARVEADASAESEDDDFSSEPPPRTRANSSRGSSRALLVAVCVGLLGVLAADGLGAWYLFFKSKPTSSLAAKSVDTKFFPANTEIVLSVRVDEIMSSEVFKQIKQEFPDLEKMLESDGLGEEMGLSLEDVSHVVVAANVTAGNPEGVGIVKLKKPTTAESLLAKLKQPSKPQQSSVGRHTMYGRRDTGFCLVDGDTLLVGPDKFVREILQHDKTPELSEVMKALLKQVDFSKTVAAGVTLKGVSPQIAGAMGKNAGIDPNMIEQFRKSIDGLVLQVGLAADVEMSATVICPDAKQAGELSTQLTQVLTPLKQDQQVKDDIKKLLEKISISATGSNVVITSRFDPAPVIQSAKEAMGQAQSPPVKKVDRRPPPRPPAPGPGPIPIPPPGPGPGGQETPLGLSTDQEAANKKYERKELVVEGEVVSSSMSAIGGEVVLASGDGAGSLRVVAKFHSGRLTQKPAKGTTVKIKGQCMGKIKNKVEIWSCEMQ